MTDPRPSAGSDRGAAAPAGRRLGEDGAQASALDRVLREADYRERLSREARPLFQLERTLRAGLQGEPSRRFCLRVAEEAERVEYGLLDVGARGNRAYALLAELVSAVRWTAKSVHALLHLRGRIRRYLGERSDLAGFRSELDRAIAWLSGRLEAQLDAVVSEASGPLGVPLPKEGTDAAALEAEEVRWRLPQDLDAAESVDERSRIAELATSFLRLADELEEVVLPSGDDPAAREALVNGPFSGAAAQEARVRMHGIQSGYDVVVAGTPLEGTDPDLKVFRGYVSILLHLLEAVAYLLQVHGRFSGDLRSERVRGRAEPLVDPGAALRLAVEFGLRNAVACFREARAVGARLLERYTRIRAVTLDLPPGRKLHLRPAGLIVRVVQHHGKPVDMGMADETVDARQLMDVILLAAGNPTSTQVRFRGDERALADLQLLFEHRLGEEGLDDLPSQLSYLRPTGRGTAPSTP